MYLSKLIKITLKKEKAAIILFLCACICNGLFYYFLYGDMYILYPIELSAFFLAIYLLYKISKYKALYKYLEESKNSPSYKSAENSEFEEIFSEISGIHDNYISKIYEIENREKDKEKLLIEWIHNMKTSVSVINLAIDKLPDIDASKDIRDENNLLQKNLEGALNIFRLDSFTKDYVPEAINLKELVKEAINSQKRNFIYSKVFPDIDINEDLEILSDKKWSRYVVIQVISNAIKYSHEGGKVCFYAENYDGKVKLFIKDYGIGIKNEELTRVFDAFYTGSNGRIKNKSTGIGLYMCKNICENLNEDIDIESKVGEGTTVSITYLANNLSSL